MTRPGLFVLVLPFLLLAPSPARCAAETVGVCQLMQEPDVRWLSTDFLPVRVNAAGRFEWSRVDALVVRAEKRGLKILARPYAQSGRPVTAAEYGRLLGAAAARYNGDGREDMPGLMYPVTGWIIDGALQPEAAQPNDPEAYAEFAAAAYLALRAADPNVTAVIAAGTCEPLAGKQPAANAGYQERFFARLGQRLAAVSPRNLAVAFDLAADSDTYASLAPLAAFWRSALEAGGLGTVPIWILSLSLPERGEAQRASDTIKLILCAMAAGIDKTFFVTPLPESALDQNLDRALAAARAAQGTAFCAEAFAQAAGILGWSNWVQIREQTSGPRWQFIFGALNNTVRVVWSVQPGGDYEVDVERPFGRVRIMRLTPEKTIVFSKAEIVSGRVIIPDSPFPVFIQMDKDPDSCNCPKKKPQ